MAESIPGKQQMADIQVIALDVDGVLTDGGFWWGAEGEELKRFCFADIMGLSVARRAGYVLALISGENSPLVDRYAEKMLIQHVVKGCRDKAGALRELSSALGIRLQAFCFMGDDINDIAAMRIAGLSCAPSGASPAVLAQAQFVTTRPGGNGAVRELVDALLLSRDLDALEILATK